MKKKTVFISIIYILLVIITIIHLVIGLFIVSFIHEEENVINFIIKEGIYLSEDNNISLEIKEIDEKDFVTRKNKNTISSGEAYYLLNFEVDDTIYDFYYLTCSQENDVDLNFTDYYNKTISINQKDNIIKISYFDDYYLYLEVPYEENI